MEYSKYLKYSSKVNSNHYLNACKEGNLDLLLFFDNLPEGKNKPEFIYFDKKSNAWSINVAPINEALANKQFGISDYFFNKNAYKKQILNEEKMILSVFTIFYCENYDATKYLLDNTTCDLNKNDSFIYWNIIENRLDIFKLIIEHPKQNIDLTRDDFFVIKTSCENNKLDFLHYLLIEQNLKLNESIMNFINGDNPTETVYENVLNILEKKETYKNINKSLNNENISNVEKRKFKL